MRYIDELNAMELHLSGTNPSIYISSVWLDDIVIRGSMQNGI